MQVKLLTTDERRVYAVVLDAGDYGFRKTTYDIAMLAGERGFLPQVRAAGDARSIADGFSCREQAVQGGGRMPTTLPEVLVREP